MEQEIFSSASPGKLQGKEIIEIPLGIMLQGKEIFFLTRPSKVMGKEITVISRGITLQGKREIAKQMPVSVIPDDKQKLADYQPISVYFLIWPESPERQLSLENIRID